MVQFLTDYEQGYYLSYPTNNGFYNRGKSAVLGKMNGTSVSLTSRTFDTGEEFEIIDVPFQGDIEKVGFVLFDVAPDSNTLIYRAQKKIWAVDLTKPEHVTCVFSPPDGMRIEGLQSLSRDGNDLYIVLRSTSENVWTAVHVNLKSGISRSLFSRRNWCIGHIQVSPFDTSWVGFCHDNQLDIPDRVCGWHESEAPNGVCLFEQNPSSKKDLTYFCHERWCADRLGVIVVAYGTSPKGIPGLYEMYIDDSEPQRICAYDHFWHCNVAPNGRWAVADTMPSIEDGICDSDIVLIEIETGKMEKLLTVRSNMASQLTHSHPRFTPDSSHVLFQDAYDSETFRSRIGKIKVMASS